MTTSTTPVASPLRTNRGFHLLWFGEAVSVFGSMTTSIALPVLAVTAFAADATMMGLLTAAIWVPWLVLGLPAGGWVDRGDNRRVMIAADLAGVLAFATVPLAWAAGRLTLTHLLLVAFAGGVKDVFFRTAYPGLIARIVRADDLGPANARIYGTESAMQVAGPGVGGLLLAVMSAASILVVNVAAFLVSAVCLWRIRPPAEGGTEPTAREPLGRLVADGLRVTFADPYLRWFTVQGGVSNLALTGYGALLVLFLVRDLAVSPTAVGLVMALGMAGGVVGASVATIVSRRWGSARALTGLQLLGGPPALLIGCAFPGAGVALVPVGAALVGVGVVGANVVRGAFRQRYVPADLLGRTSGASAVVTFGGMPVAGLLAGRLGDAVGLRTTILLMAGLHVLASVAVVRSPWARLHELPEGQLGGQPSGR